MILYEVRKRNLSVPERTTYRIRIHLSPILKHVRPIKILPKKQSIKQTTKYMPKKPITNMKPIYKLKFV